MSGQGGAKTCQFMALWLVGMAKSAELERSSCNVTQANARQVRPHGRLLE